MTEEAVVPDHLVTWVITETTDTEVTVTFTCATTSIVHARSVNTIGCDDDAAVQQRLSEVARGVHNKICVGAITAPSDEEVAADAELITE
jgi:hypothetical protein